MSKLIEFLRLRWFTFIVAAIAGPLFFMWIGWLVPASDLVSAQASALLSYKAQQCAKQAMADASVTPEILGDFNKRREVAATYVITTGNKKADTEVMNKCSALLAG